MGLIDVTELLVDPDFIDPIQIITRDSTVNSMGENTLTESSANAYGSIQPISGKDLMRLPDSLRVQNLSTFWIKGDIEITDGDHYPTILVFRSKRYQVKQLKDYSNWGQGWVEGFCVVETPDGS